MMNKSDIGKPVRVALVDCGGWITVSKEEDSLHNGKETLPKGWFRLSEWVEVTFPALPTEVWVPEAHKALDHEVEEAHRELNAKLSRIADKRAQLLQITHNPEGGQRLTQEESVEETIEDLDAQPAPSPTSDDDIPF